MNQEWANATVNVLVESLKNFGFDALYHSTGPPYSISLNLQEELSASRDMLMNGSFVSDFAFQEYIQSIIQRTHDFHMTYAKPGCYSVTFIQPFSFDMRPGEGSHKHHPFANQPKVYLTENRFSKHYSEIYPNVNIDHLMGKEILLLNSVEFVTSLMSWADNHETISNHRSVRFNSALRSYLYRSAMYININPLEDINVTLVDGSTHTLPWIASYTSDFANIEKCAAIGNGVRDSTSNQFPVSSSTTLPVSSNYRRHSSHWDYLHASLPSHNFHLLRPDRTYIVSTPGPVQCFIQAVHKTSSKRLGITQVLVIRLSEFTSPGPYRTVWMKFLRQITECLSVDFDIILIDVMQNTGGYVCLGKMLLQLLVKDFADDPSKAQLVYDIPHSLLMDKYISTINHHNLYPDSQEVEQILNMETQMPFKDGMAFYYPGRNVTQGGIVSYRSNFFTVDCSEAQKLVRYPPSKYLPPERLIILTDGSCGSTCATFSKTLQESSRATFVGLGGLWDEPMDIASYAGGVVCNPDYLHNIATWINASFPRFLTNQNWQFAWATSYSEKQPTRQTQFTMQEPDFRIPFWSFPHVSIDEALTASHISSMYDNVISSTLDRLECHNGNRSLESHCPYSTSTTSIVVVCIFSSFLGAVMLHLISIPFQRSISTRDYISLV